MGVYAPTPFVTLSIMDEIEKLILQPTFEGLRSEGSNELLHLTSLAEKGLGRTFTGCLFTGIMLTSSGLKMLESNTRFGDPETQSMILLLDGQTDLAAVLLTCTKGMLDRVHIKTVPAFTCNVVVVAGGYP